ncbi:hypothetical protein MKW94_018349 [Papaver nudicaule]|uniref:RRM Nup35-type domain-containing protein n=1 Tax=Papaver nudicaule TaxID=74823 RepID=A0AA41VJK9_PAPNU|nr:hypothetical protein [Papaver nudicaule]
MVNTVSSETNPDIKTPKSELADTHSFDETKPDTKIPKSEMVFDTHLSDDVKLDIKPPKPEAVVKPELVENSVPAENPDEEVWVTVYGITHADEESVLVEFKKCGVILDYHSGQGNWMHILYQNQSEAQKALSMSGKKIDSHLIVGVNPLDLIEKQALNERQNKSQVFVIATTGNVYNVTLSTSTPCRCNCADLTDPPCKHILYDCPIWRKGLKPCQLADLLNMPTSVEGLAGARAREEFHRRFSPLLDEVLNDEKCPICHQYMDDAGDVVECGSCETVAHKDCLSVWRKRVAGKVHVWFPCNGLLLLCIIPGNDLLFGFTHPAKTLL